MPVRYSHIACLQEIYKVRSADVVVVREDAAAHVIEEDIGEVMDVGLRVAGKLNAVRAAHITKQVLARPLKALLDSLVGIPPFHEAGAQRRDLRVAPAYIGCKVPLGAAAGRQLDRRRDEIVAPSPGQQVFSFD